jgi:hypothetical protein
MKQSWNISGTQMQSARNMAVNGLPGNEQDCPSASGTESPGYDSAMKQGDVTA